ncbi:isoaspartyl peptidase/L-asparaginase isoform X1 [Amia ocellicauda]|uniref:isoaspartyl peptidase/L-asparaginase isoform X1 n=1 Tax=Amia ocellicauda TaxID=2972642 RepID=UPI003463853A
MLPVIVAHGGAGYILPDREASAIAGVREAVLHGYSILQRGGTALDAVEETVVLLENNPKFNAGCGSVLNELGEVEMDAIIMDGKTLNSGAVSAIRRIANPIKLSRLVMEKTSHLCLTDQGASRFAKEMGIPEVPEESLITEYSRMRWQKLKESGLDPVETQMGKTGTVGAVAIDSEGNIASATSTGGMLNKMVGRVGDTPCIGCGAYADNQVGAVSPTGHGEAIMKVTLSRLILFHMEQGKSPKEAADAALGYMYERVQGLAGVVVVDKTGDWSARFNSRQMSWAAAKNNQLHYGIYKDQINTEPIPKT